MLYLYSFFLPSHNSCNIVKNTPRREACILKRVRWWHRKRDQVKTSSKIMGRPNMSSIAKSQLMATNIKWVRQSHCLLRIIIQQEGEDMAIYWCICSINKYLHTCSCQALISRRGSRQVDYAGVASVCREIIYNLVKMVEHRACNQKVDQCCQRAGGKGWSGGFKGVVMDVYIGNSITEQTLGPS